MQLLLREVLPLLSGQMEQTMPGARMEHVVAGLPEDERLLRVVVSHDGGSWRLLGQSNQAMDVLDRLEGLLPELHVDGRLQLNKTRVQMHGLRFWVVQVDGPLLVLVLVDVAKMSAQLQISTP